VTFQKNHPGQRGKLICVTFKPSPSLRVFDVAAGWSGWVTVLVSNRNYAIMRNWFMKKRLTIILVGSLVVVLGLTYLLFGGCTSHAPNPPPPPEATDVHFLEYSAWQAWNYAYRFDAPPVVCERFAVGLMKSQSLHSTNCTITTNAFTRFPLLSRHFPDWFDVSTVKNGLLISGDDWIYAVVDLDRGRLYYYDSH
jgi:hypothetical protein